MNAPVRIDTPCVEQEAPHSAARGITIGMILGLALWGLILLAAHAAGAF